MKSRLPGFTAEASLSATVSHHYIASAVQDGPYIRRVMPQLWGSVWLPNGECNPNCACLIWENCPCCIGPGPGGGVLKNPFGSFRL